MKLSDIPTKFNVAFGSAADGGTIRAIPETPPVQAGAASLDKGFPAVTQQPIGSGGVPPFGQDMNGILLQITQWSRWQNAGGTVPYDAAFQTAIGGYPQNSIVASLVTPASFFISTVDDNTTNPDASGAGWSPWGPSSGDMKPTIKTAADYGWLMLNDGTIGNASSNATALASATAAGLFSVLWGLSNIWAPLLTSAGAPVARGASAAADFAANRQLTLFAALGRAFGAAGAGAGLTSRALGQALGEETHLLTIPELASHTHPFTSKGSGTPTADGGSNGSSFTARNNVLAGVTDPTGGDVAHNNMQPSTFVNWMIKL